MPGFKCPFCGEVMAITPETSYNGDFGFYSGQVQDLRFIGFSNSKRPTKDFELELHRCPNCSQIAIKIRAKNIRGEEYTALVRPTVQCERFPDYVPEPIKRDYEEASSIVMLSPKASATLSRRCLQGMIHDFWGIKEGNLAKEIIKLEGKIPPDQWKVIDRVRSLGNIGAHMENDINLIVDIEPDEAQKLIKLIELLIKNWYIDRHDQETLFDDIIAIDTEKQEQRKG